MTDPSAAALASGKMRVTRAAARRPDPFGRVRARKSPCNALKRFKTGSEIGTRAADKSAGRSARFRPQPFLQAAEGSLAMTDPWAAAPASGKSSQNRQAAGRPDPFGQVSRPEKSAQSLEKAQSRLGYRRHALGASPLAGAYGSGRNLSCEPPKGRSR